MCGGYKEKFIVSSKKKQELKENSHGYEIYNIETGDVVKTGISGQKLNRNGTSPRANRQVSKLNGNGTKVYGARVVKKNIKNRSEALEWERKNALKLWQEKNSMSIHKDQDLGRINNETKGNRIGYTIYKR